MNKMLYLALVTAIALLYVTPALATSIAPPEEGDYWEPPHHEPAPRTWDYLEGRINPQEFNYVGEFGFGLGGENVSSGAAGSKVSLFGSGLGMNMQARGGWAYDELRGLFFQSAARFDLGIANLSIEDPTLGLGRSKSGTWLGAYWDFGFGGHWGPLTLTGGFLARTAGTGLGGHEIAYRDTDQNGTPEAHVFRPNYSYWGSFVEASLNSGRLGGFGGDGLVLRFMPNIAFGFSDGQAESWGWSARAQTMAPFDLAGIHLLYLEVGGLKADGASLGETYWARLGLSWVFGN